MAEDITIQFLIGFGVALACGLIAFFARIISKSGLIGGVIFGTIIYGCTGWQGFLIPLTFVVIASWATKHGYAKKAAMGIAQEEGGKRGAKHALANILAGTIFSILTLIAYIFHVHFSNIGFENWSIPDLNKMMYWYWFGISCNVAMIGSFATAVADTISSEMGQLYGKTPINPVTFRRVKPGSEGAISVEGTLLGILASALIAGISIFFVSVFIDLMEFYDTAPLWSVFVAVIVGAFLGNLIESFLGAMPKLNLDNEMMNFLNTLIGGLISGIFIFVMIWINR